MSHELDKFGMPVGWALLALGNLIGVIADHGLQILGAISLVVGIGCQGYTTWMRHQDFTDRRKRRADQ